MIVSFALLSLLKKLTYSQPNQANGNGSNQV
jgi:hypothetical protein